MEARTLFDLYRRDVEVPRPEHYTHWTPEHRRAWSTGEFFDATAALAEGLLQLGVQRADRVLLLASDRPEWHIADLSVLALGAVDVPVYGTLTAAQVSRQARDCGAVAAIVEGEVEAARVLEAMPRAPSLRHVVQIEGTSGDGVLAFDDVVDSGRSPSAAARFWDRAAAARAEDLATIIYTSGTTGEPKGVMLTHGNLRSNVLAAAPRVPVDEDDLALEFLPLCHVLERMVSYVYMWRACSRAYCSIYDVADLIGRIAPSVFVAVPRFFEKLHDRIVSQAHRSSASAAAFEWALDVGRRAVHRRHAGKSADGLLGAQLRIADKTVFGRVREGLGGHVRVCISGGAPLPLRLAEFFHALGITVLEGYGLTETSPVIAVNGAAPGELRLGTVGRPLENLQVKLAPDGELLVRGPSVMTGYWGRPDATAAVIDEEGFFHTGDIAEIDDGGFVVITDRKKEIIVTAGGKNIAPAPIEDELARSPMVDAAVLVGDGRPFVVALISPNVEALRQWAAEIGLDGLSIPELVHHPRVREVFSEVVTRVNGGLARYEQIKRFHLLSGPLSVEGGQLTPTLKVKRRVVEEELGAIVEQLYQEAV